MSGLIIRILESSILWPTSCTCYQEDFTNVKQITLHLGETSLRDSKLERSGRPARLRFCVRHWRIKNGLCSWSESVFRYTQKSELFILQSILMFSRWRCWQYTCRQMRYDPIFEQRIAIFKDDQATMKGLKSGLAFSKLMSRCNDDLNSFVGSLKALLL